MAIKAVLVVTLVSAAGDLVQPPVILPQDDMAACNAAAKMTIEALALGIEERALPTRAAGTPIEAVQQPSTGIWMVRYTRQKRPDESADPVVTGRMVRAVCRAH
jgi:hypothetical protein